MTGTRGALDIVEIASHLMEHFVNDPRSLRLFARHKTTGDAIPEAMVTKLMQSKNVFGALDLQQQVRRDYLLILLHCCLFCVSNERLPCICLSAMLPWLGVACILTLSMIGIRSCCLIICTVRYCRFGMR